MAPNPIFDQGPYNPATYVAANPATWPQYRPPAVAYQPGMWWTSTGTGTVAGQPAKPGDYIFAIYKPRMYGDLLYGDGDYGGHPEGDWTSANVTFSVWNASLPPWQQLPFPNAGCPFGDFPGWRIVIDALYQDLPTRVYGMFNYGDEVYGDSGSPAPRWADITRPSYDVNIRVGTIDGSQTVDVTEISIELLDDEGVWVDFATPARYFQPFVGNPIRVGFLDPGLKYHPLAVGSIETIHDDHDTLPRYVTIQALGHMSHLVNTVPFWQRPQELTSQRIPALVAAGAWRFNELDLHYPGDVMLKADDQPADRLVRNELDRTAASAGWTFDTDNWGSLRVRKWPLDATGTPIVATDCIEDGPAGALLTGLISFVADMSQILNVAVMTNTAAPDPDTVNVTDPVSIGKYGRQSQTLGFPMFGLAFLNAADLQPFAAAVVARMANIINHVEDVVADTDVDRNWLPALVDLDSGRAIHTVRTGIRPFELDGVVVGFDHTITPGRIATSIHTATTTPTY